jgi:elongation factor Ts
VVLACETDFVAKNDTFIGLADSIVDILADIEGRVASRGDLDAEKQEQIDKLLKDNFVTIGENMQVVDLFVDDRQGYIYTHPGDKVAAVVYYE